MKVTYLFSALLSAAALTPILATPAHAAGVSGQGTWETTLQGRDINRNVVAATDASAVYLYDTTLDVTWLRDANARANSIYNNDYSSTSGKMTWDTANTWAANLSTGSGSNAVNDWRLPTLTVANPNPISSIDGTTDYGYNVPGSSSEMASLFYDTLGNKSVYNKDGTVRQTGYGLTNTGSFQNMQSSIYWYGLEYEPGTNFAWGFSTTNGGQYNPYKDWVVYAMAVRPGDVAPVPEPEAYLMLLTGLGLMGAMSRRRSQVLGSLAL